MAHGTVCFREATLLDAPLLRHWDTQPHVIACDPDSDWQWETELPKQAAWREQLIAEENGRPVGFVQIMDPAKDEEHYWGDVPGNLRAIDIWLGPPQDLGRGLGTTIMTMALERCFAEPAVNAVVIDPLAGNVRAHRFYRRLGFVFVEERYFDEDLCHVHRLDRQIFETR